jgi:hypothetical protein
MSFKACKMILKKLKEYNLTNNRFFLKNHDTTCRIVMTGSVMLKTLNLV